MKPLFEPLQLSAQTSYAQLLDAAQMADLARSVSSLPGSFARKRVKDNTYWYFQHTDVSGHLRQIYVGPDNERTRALVDAHDRGESSQRLQSLIKSTIVLGCEPVLLPHFRVIRRLADYGFFNAGGVLVGTHAFLAYGNMLGVRWGETRARRTSTSRMRASRWRSRCRATYASTRTRRSNRSQWDSLPVLTVAGNAGASYATPSNPDFQLDFLTPLHRRANEPYVHPQLKVTLQR